MPIPVIDEQSFRTEVLQSQLPVLIVFHSDRSAASKSVEPELEAVAQDLEGKAQVVKVSVERSPSIAQSLRIKSIPTFMVFMKGRPVDAQEGPLRRQQIKAMLEPFLPRAQGSILSPELAQLLQQGQVVPVDIREAAVFNRAHLPGAISLPEDEIEGRLAELHMLAGEPVLYCRGGDKAKALSEKLTSQGMPVAFLEGGVLAWESEGLPLERPD